jgi:HSP20 family protein
MSVARKPSRTPFAELALLQREINLLFERLSTLDRSEPPAAGEWSPGVDVFESHGRTVVVLEVPGLPPEALKVAIRDGCLVVSGERREARPAGGMAVFLCVERPQGRFSRKIPVPAAVDLRQARACLANGLLTVMLPRLKDRRGRETVIPVEREDE